MDNRVKKALVASLNKYAEVAAINVEGFETELLAAFELDTKFLDKVVAFDAVFDAHPKFEELREVFFDLLMVNFFSSDVQNWKMTIWKVMNGQKLKKKPLIGGRNY